MTRTTGLCAPSARRRTATTTGAVVALTTALGLTVATGGPAQAADGIWDITSVALPWTPATSTDGDISFALVDNADAKNSEVVSYTRGGSPVQYASRFNAKDLAWGPAGDQLLTVPAGGFTTTTISPTPLERVSQISRPTPSLWSPYGDSTVGATGSAGSYQARAQWVARNTSDALTPTQATSPGAGAVGPLGNRTVVVMKDSGGNTDLGVVVTGFPRQGNAANNRPSAAPTALGYASLAPHDPVVSNDGTLAFVGTSTDGPAVFVDEGKGAVAVAQLGEDCAGTQRPAFAPSGKSLAYVASSGGCTASVLHVLDKAGNSFVGGTDATVVASTALDTTTVTHHFANASWRAKTPKAANTRLGGRDRIATGIAVSQHGYPTGTDGAIIASAESFPDALVAGPLSGAAGYPLLVTGKSSLDSRVLAELKRLMPTANSRFVFIVGGTGSVSDAVRKTLEANGFQVVRLAGRDRFETSVAVARNLDDGYSGSTSPRTTAVLADGMNFPDALSAGPVATQFYGPVLLTNKTSVPTSVKSYVNGRTNIRTVHAIGGNAAKAVGVFGGRAGERIVGKDRFDTSAKVAQRFFADALTVGYANGMTFPDALTGGALMSAMWEPLMLVQAGSTPAPVSSMANLYRPTTDEVLTFGGSAVVSDAVRGALATAAGTQTAVWGPDTAWDDNPYYPATSAAARSLQAKPGKVGSSRLGTSRLGADQVRPQFDPRSTVR